MVDEGAALGPAEVPIFELRGELVVLDRHVAQLFGIETRKLNQATKRNNARFPDSVVFRLNDDEWSALKHFFASPGRGGARRKPWAFTERGIYLAATVLRSDAAEQTVRTIIDVFLKVKRHEIDVVQVEGSESVDAIISKGLPDQLSSLSRTFDELASEARRSFEKNQAALDEIEERQLERNAAR